MWDQEAELKSLNARLERMREENELDASSGSVVTAVVNRVIEGVRQGRFAPGQRLIASDLAKEFNVSRVPIREALHVLAGEGIVTLMPNRGAKVNELTASQLSDFMEYSEALLVLGVRKAASRKLDADEKKLINQALSEVKVAAEQGTPLQFVDCLYMFHVIVNSISRNEFIDSAYRRKYFAFFNRFLADLVHRPTWPTYVEHYEHIADAIVRGYAKEAEAAFVDHISWVRSQFHEADQAKSRG